MKGFDYSQAGLCFVTICVQEHNRIFGRVSNGAVILDPLGWRFEMSGPSWLCDFLPQRFSIM